MTSFGVLPTVDVLPTGRYEGKREVRFLVIAPKLQEMKVNQDKGARRALIVVGLGLIAIGFISFAMNEMISPDGHTSPSVPRPLLFETATPYAGQVASAEWHLMKGWYKFPLRVDGTDLTHLRPMIWEVLSDGRITTPEWEKVVAAKKKASVDKSR